MQTTFQMVLPASARARARASAFASASASTRAGSNDLADTELETSSAQITRIGNTDTWRHMEIRATKVLTHLQRYPCHAFFNSVITRAAFHHNLHPIRSLRALTTRIVPSHEMEIKSKSKSW